MSSSHAVAFDPIVQQTQGGQRPNRDFTG